VETPQQTIRVFNSSARAENNRTKREVTRSERKSRRYADGDYALRLARSTDPKFIKKVVSDPKTTAERAIRDLDDQLDKQVGQWLAQDDVPLSWKAPHSLVRQLFTDTPTQIEPYESAAAGTTLYRATREASFSPVTKSKILNVYHRQIAVQRFGMLGGGLFVVLACLGLLAGYIRADEATKGYYTNRLRLAAAAGAGAIGVVAYQWLS
jgi:hypothetical protein